MNVVTFPGQASVFQPIGHFVRLGESSYGKVAELHGMGRLKGRRFVVDGSKIKYQRQIIRALQASGAEVVLDTRAAELSSRKYAGGYARNAPWASGTGAMTAEDFSPRRGGDVYDVIAECAVDYGVDVVLAPTHFLSDPDFASWFGIDTAGCVRLRAALDAAGGQSIAIDYPVIASMSDLTDEGKRMEIMEGLARLPFDNLWIRMATSSSIAGPVTARSMIGMLGRCHNFGRPIVADYMGGLTGEAILSMNVVSGIAHGLGERNSFNSVGWGKEPKERDDDDGQNGRATRIEVSSFGKSFLHSEMKVLLSAHGGKTALLPGDRSALPGGLSNLKESARLLSAYEAEHRIDGIAEIPTDKRPEVFATNRMREAVSSATRVASLKPKPEVAAEEKVDLNQLMDRAKETVKQMMKLRETYEDVAAERSESSTLVRAMPAPRRMTAPSRTGS
jgi:hypothetical protein